MKKILSLSILLLAGTSGAFADSILVSPASQNVSAGQTFTADINIDNIPDLYDYQFSLSFDPAVLAAQSIGEGPLFANTGNSFFLPGSIDNNAGSISLTADTLFGPTGVAGPGTLAVLQFTAIGSGMSSIDFSPLGDLILQDSQGNALSVTPVSGTVDVAAVPEPPTLLLAGPLLALILLAFGVAKFRRLFSLSGM
ncbi:MAG: cohesin domain-containing protein [Candidatus Acidiferrales bacterium]